MYHVNGSLVSNASDTTMNEFSERCLSAMGNRDDVKYANYAKIMYWTVVIDSKDSLDCQYDYSKTKFPLRFTCEQRNVWFDTIEKIWVYAECELVKLGEKYEASEYRWTNVDCDSSLMNLFSRHAFEAPATTNASR